MRKKEYLHSGDWTVRFAAYCGMEWAIGDERQSADDAYATAQRVIERRRASGHEVTELKDRQQWEISAPEDAQLVPDTAGVMTIVPHLVPAVRCFDCDDLVIIGDECQNCRDNSDPPFDDEVSFPTED